MMFEGFVQERIAVGDVSLSVRHNGATDKPPLALLHGYPQTSAMWHLMVTHLSGYHLICPDLRGYGASDKPPSTPDHMPYAKRAMAADIVGLLDHFGHAQAFVCAHDRGARVAHRLGLDHPARVSRMVLLDIAPTREMYAGTTAEFAKAYWHWFFLIQPFPLPEEMIGKDPDGYWMRKCVNQAGGTHPFSNAALQEYLNAFRDPEAIHASCEDYRAAATIDIAHDDADAGAKLSQPLHVLWAKQGVIERCFDPLALWAARAASVTGEALETTHYMAEEIPEDLAQRINQFFNS